jgi:hypothetical protein
MKSYVSLPEGYSELLSLDLQKDKKLSLLMNVSALLIAIVMMVGMHFLVPVWTVLDENNPLVASPVGFLIVWLVGIVLYVILHEGVHGIAMKICGTKKIKFGLTKDCAYAGSDDYYNRKAYIFIALAPVVLWGVVLAVVNVLVPVYWFWIIYLFQILNISGAVGDLYVTIRFSCLPPDILIRDYGVGMIVYSSTASTRE